VASTIIPSTIVSRNSAVRTGSTSAAIAAAVSSTDEQFSAST